MLALQFATATRAANLASQDALLFLATHGPHAWLLKSHSPSWRIQGRMHVSHTGLV